MSITITPITIAGFPVDKPVSNITPFTYRDGLTYLGVLEALRDWLKNSLVPDLNVALAASNDAWNAEVTALVEAVNLALTTQAENVNGALEDQTEANDLAINNLTNFVNGQVDAINLAMTNLQNGVNGQLSSHTDFVNNSVNNLTDYVNNQVNSIINDSIELQDTVMAGILADENSDSHSSLAGIVGDIITANPPTVSDSAVNTILEDTNSDSRATVIELVEGNAYHTNAEISALVSGAGETQSAVRVQAGDEIYTQLDNKSGDVYTATKAVVNDEVEYRTIDRFTDLAALNLAHPAASTPVGVMAYAIAEDTTYRLTEIDSVKYWADWDSGWRTTGIKYFTANPWSNPNGTNTFRHRFSSGKLVLDVLIVVGASMTGGGLGLEFNRGRNSTPPVREMAANPAFQVAIVDQSPYFMLPGQAMLWTNDDYLRINVYVFNYNGTNVTLMSPLAVGTQPISFAVGDEIHISGEIDIYG